MKIKVNLNYILSLFYVKLTTLCIVKLIESEESRFIYQFLQEYLRNHENIFNLIRFKT